MTTFSENHSRGKVIRGQVYAFEGKLYRVAAIGETGRYSLRDEEDGLWLIDLNTKSDEFASETFVQMTGQTLVA